jgi:hypothetical protein
MTREMLPAMVPDRPMAAELSAKPVTPVMKIARSASPRRFSHSHNGVQP